MMNTLRVPSAIEDLDEVDQQIIGYLQKNGRESFTKIADEIGVPPSTVRDRTNRLIEHGILRVLGVLNPLKTRHRVMANIGVKLSGGNHREVARDIAQFDEVSYLVICAGSFDLLVEVMCRDNAHMLDIISAIQRRPDVSGTEVFPYFSIVKEVFDMGSLDL
jgi:Lrp/AsnC family transcriptional regulator for asnA, asnC and gidA